MAPFLGTTTQHRPVSAGGLRRFGAGLVCSALGLATASAAAADTCPPALSASNKLAVVVARDMRSAKATLHRFVRAAAGQPWTPAGAPIAVVVGKNGLGWGAGFDHVSREGEPRKHEGDQRSPAGVFALGQSFGLSPDPDLAAHVVLKPGENVCVDDAKSEAYNTIVAERSLAPGVGGERMWQFPLYRNGLFIDYPTDRKHRRGSCIFVHVWRSAEEGTLGCIAMSERHVKELQRFGAGGGAIAILPAHALPRFAGCLPTTEPASSQPTSKAHNPR